MNIHRYKVGDRVKRKPEECYESQYPLNSPYWTATIIGLENKEEVYEVKTDTGSKSIWNSAFFNRWTKLQDVLK